MLKEPLLVQKQTIHQQKALDLSFNLPPQKWAWYHQEGATPPRREKHIFLIFYGRVEVFWLFGFKDISRRPLLSYSHFQGVKLKLKSRAFCWCIVCFSTGSISVLNINLNIFPDFAYPPCSRSKMSNFGQCSYRRKCQQRWVGGQK